MKIDKLLGMDDVGNLIRNLWSWSQRIPGGKIAFSKAIGRFARYSGSIGAVMDELRSGYGRAVLRDKPAVRNHLRSVHAMALANFAEMASGISLMYSLPPLTRGILVKFEVSYEKKARGTLTAEASFSPPMDSKAQDFPVIVEIKNQAGERVAVATALWRLGPLNEAKA